MVSLAATASGRHAHPVVASTHCNAGEARELEIVATTDVHGRIRGWDYYASRPDSAVGLTRAATIIDSVRAANPGRVVLVDAGDLLQGNPFTYVAARVSHTRTSPVIAAMNELRYDAAVVGNHEFNYGVPYLDSAVSQARFPFLAGNVYRRDSTPAFRAVVLVKRGDITVGIVGATTPGSDVWDQANLHAAGLTVGDIVPAVRRGVERARQEGADVVVVVLHSGLDGPSTYDTVSTGVASEDVAARVAAEVPGIEVVVYGHSHRENPGTRIGSTLLIQPKNWASSVAVATVKLACGASGAWSASPATGTVIRVRGHAEDPAMLRVTARAHSEAVAYAASSIGTTPDTWLADSARRKDTQIIDFIIRVQQNVTHAELASASAFDLRAHFGPGPITVAEIAQLYPYENTLRAVKISGAQLRAYIEQASRYYVTSPTGAFVVDPAVAGYNFDIVGGVDYRLDLTRPLGSRVVSLTFHGRPVAPTDSFTLAVNNYRQTGGGGYTMLQGAPVVYDQQQEIRQLLIDEVRRKGVIRKSDYFDDNWGFVPHDSR